MHAAFDFSIARASLFWAYAQTERHVFKHSHVAEEGVVLEYKANLALTHVTFRGVLAVKVDAASVRRFKTCDDAKQCGLAAARWAQ